MAENPVVPIRAHPDDPLYAASRARHPDRKAMDEQLWVRALRERDEATFSELLDRYYPAMLRLAMAHVRSRAQAEEVVQDTWLAALGGIHRFDGRSSLRAWIFRILLNRARSRGAREARVIAFSVLADGRDPAGVPIHVDALSVVPGRPSPEGHVLARELRTQIERAIATLPRAQREVITLRDVEGWSAADVCEALRITAGNQRVLLHRARARVRNALAGYLFEPTDEPNARAVGM
jgi:RNA polymerase sigma-70 factor, ECF subfamily